VIRLYMKQLDTLMKRADSKNSFQIDIVLAAMARRCTDEWAENHDDHHKQNGHDAQGVDLTDKRFLIYPRYAYLR